MNTANRIRLAPAKAVSCGFRRLALFLTMTVKPAKTEGIAPTTAMSIGAIMIFSNGDPYLLASTSEKIIQRVIMNAIMTAADIMKSPRATRSSRWGMPEICADTGFSISCKYSGLYKKDSLMEVFFMHELFIYQL